MFHFESSAMIFILISEQIAQYFGNRIAKIGAVDFTNSGPAAATLSQIKARRCTESDAARRRLKPDPLPVRRGRSFVHQQVNPSTDLFRRKRSIH
jgi:hypothetical protein